MHGKLGIGIKFIEDVMVDYCTIERDVDGNTDAVLDEESGELVNPPPQLIYRGKCHFRPTSRAERLDEDLGEAPESRRTYRVLLPLAQDGVPVTGIRAGDVMRVVATHFEEDIVGEPLMVTDVGSRTLPTYRRLIVQARQRMERYG